MCKWKYNISKRLKFMTSVIFVKLLGMSIFKVKAFQPFQTFN